MPGRSRQGTWPQYVPGGQEDQDDDQDTADGLGELRKSKAPPDDVASPTDTRPASLALPAAGLSGGDLRVRDHGVQAFRTLRAFQRSCLSRLLRRPLTVLMTR